MKISHVLASALLVLSISSTLRGDDLPRHGVIGLALAARDPTRPEDLNTNPPTVQTVTPGGAGEAAGFKAGDVVRSLDGTPVASSADFAMRIGRHVGGDQVSVVIVRDSQKLTETAKLRPRPYETSPDAEVLYRSVTADGARRRVIITKPKAAGRYPAVLLIGGLGCYSLDGELAKPLGYGPILAALVKRNFVTMRVEKTGEGDSDGPPCTDPKATADLEDMGYVAGLRALKSDDFVDPTRVFVFAHSLGPLLASMALPRESVRGFVAAETIGLSWFEYALDNVRRQSALVGESPSQVDADVRGQADCAYHFFIEHESAEQVSKLGTECDEMIRSYAGMPETYMHQIGDLSLGKQWQQVDAPVLVLYGTSDPATSADESRYLVDLINRAHPGRAAYVELAGMGHDFCRYASQMQFLNRRADKTPHPFDDELVTVLLSWLQNHLEG